MPGPVTRKNPLVNQAAQDLKQARCALHLVDNNQSVNMQGQKTHGTEVRLTGFLADFALTFAV